MNKLMVFLTAAIDPSAPASPNGITDSIVHAFTSVIGALFALAAPLFQSVGFIVVLVWCLTIMFSKKRGRG